MDTAFGHEKMEMREKERRNEKKNSIVKKEKKEKKSNINKEK